MYSAGSQRVIEPHRAGLVTVTVTVTVTVAVSPRFGGNQGAEIRPEPHR
jgi:hypothetical protein